MMVLKNVAAIVALLHHVTKDCISIGLFAQSQNSSILNRLYIILGLAGWQYLSQYTRKCIRKGSAAAPVFTCWHMFAGEASKLRCLKCFCVWVHYSPLLSLTRYQGLL